MKPDLSSVTKKMLDLSTGHITQSDSLLLEEYAKDCKPFVRLVAATKQHSPIMVCDYHYGYHIFAPDKTRWKDEAKAQMRKDGASKALLNILSLCVEQGFAMLCLDRDGDLIDDLPRFDW